MVQENAHAFCFELPACVLYRAFPVPCQDFIAENQQFSFCRLADLGAPVGRVLGASWARLSERAEHRCNLA